MQITGLDRVNKLPAAREFSKQQDQRQKASATQEISLKQQEPVREIELIEAIERANKAMTGPQTMFRFSIHEGTKEITVKVINEESGEVIREIPPEKILDMVAKMWELAGIFVDKKA